MQPYPGPNSVIVMDNCHIHKHPDITELIESQYVISHNVVVVRTNTTFYSEMQYEFLLPYLPDLNPIELTFSKMKHVL